MFIRPMIISVLHLVLTIRAIVRSISEKFLFGVIGGIGRAALMVLGALMSFQQMSLLMLPGFTLRFLPSTFPSALLSAGLLLVALGGPILTFAIVWAAHRRTKNVPAAQEEKVGRPFMAWVPVAILDAMYLVVSVGAAVISEPP
jgi:hypothetical protein